MLNRFFNKKFLRRLDLEPVFLLPAKIDSLSFGEDFCDEEKNLPFWQEMIEKLARKKLSWEQLLKSVQGPLKIHSLCRVATEKERRTLLHLAVLDNQWNIVSELKSVFSLNLKRDAYGLNALELAQFLRREESIRILLPLPKKSYSKQPFVSFSNPIHPELELLEYLPNPVFETQKGFEDILARTKKAKAEDQIPPEKIWMGIYFEQEIEKGIHPHVSIRYIDAELGNGVFAEQKISPCSYVGEYTGIVQERKTKDLKEKFYCLRYSVWEMGHRNFVIDAEKMGNFTRFINHSSQPNLGMQSVYWRGLPRMIFVALKEISAGEQLTFDYGNSFWKESQSIPKLI